MEKIKAHLQMISAITNSYVDNMHNYLHSIKGNYINRTFQINDPGCLPTWNSNASSFFHIINLEIENMEVTIEYKDHDLSGKVSFHTFFKLLKDRKIEEI